MGLLYGLGIRAVNFIVVFLIVCLIPGLPPRTTFPFVGFKLAANKDLKGALEPNHHLDNAERLLDNRVYGPECLIARENEIYMGIHGGEVIKVNGAHITHVTKLGQACEDVFEESRCGRPLGLAFDTKGNNLIIADAYYGIWLVDLKSNKKQLLVSPQKELPGKTINRPAKLFNDVAVDKEGNIYWTDSTSDFLLQDLVFTAFANPSGRLFKYDRVKNESKVLLDNLYFANGVALSPEEDFLVVAETGASRLMKYHLKGSNAGKGEVFVEGLPGLPDNLTPNEDGIWVPLILSVDSQNPSLFAIFSEFPNIRLFLARILYLFEAPFRAINNIYPNRISQRFVHFIGHGESVSFMIPKRATIVRLDWNGNIVGSLHGFDKSVGAACHVLEFNDYLYLGSPFNRFLARVKSPVQKKPILQARINNVRYEGMEIEPSLKPRMEKTTTAQPVVTKPTVTHARSTPTTPKPPVISVKTTGIPSASTTTTTKPTRTSLKSSTTEKPSTTKTVKSPSMAGTRIPKEPAPIKENIPGDNAAPKKEKLKVINKHGEHVEL
uniref:Strictosidine synthase conserved region domain-containing protein n=1 Tax=Glossina austeni TaxID=7395 RepID=A0A1A9VM40_GLOAU